MIRRAVLWGLCLAALAGCGEHRLLATGQALIATSDGASHVMQIPTDSRLDVEAQPDRLTGACIVERRSLGDGLVAHDVTVDLYTNRDGLTSLRIQKSNEPDTAGLVEARTATGDFTSTPACTVELSYVDDNGSAILETRGCPLAAEDARTATADIQLEIHGCAVR
jgi:hypothetical protein